MSFVTSGPTSRTTAGLLVALTSMAHLWAAGPEARAAELCWKGQAAYDYPETLSFEFTNPMNWTPKTTANCPSPNYTLPAAAAAPGPGDVAELSGGGTVVIQVTAPSGAAVGLIRSRINTLFLQGDPLVLDGVVDASTGRNVIVETVGANVTIQNDLVLQPDAGETAGTINTVQTLGATTLVLGGAISGPAGFSLGLEPQGATAITLAGTNAHAGGTVIQAGNTQGVVRAASDTAFGTGLVRFNRGVLLLATAGVANPIDVGNAGVAIKPEISETTLSGAISSCVTDGCTSSGTTLSFGDNNSSCTVASPCPRVILTGDNSAYLGSIALFQSMALNVRHGNALGGATKGTGLNINATLEIEGGITLAEPLTVNALNGSATVRSVSGDNVWNGSLTGAPRIVADVVTGKLTVNGLWGLNFNKTGDGTLGLEASNSTSLGEMAVSAGTLLVNGSIGGSGLLGVASGATLGGSGTIYSNASIAGTLAPGSPAGTLQIRGNVTFQPGATFQVEIDGATADALEILGSASVSRTVSLDGALSVSATDAVPGTYPILVTGQNVSLTGTFVDRPEGAEVEGFKLTYAGGDGNDVVLTLPACGGDTCETPPNDECYETQGSCNPATNQCEYAKRPVGTACTDDGNVCTRDECNENGQCAHPAGNAGTVCRPATGDCDVAESCTGTSAACPPDGFLAATTVCRASAGDCDPAETCTGAGPSCPLDAKSSGVCRAAASDCDAAESCDGASNDCPADAYQPLGTTCDDGNVCTQNDTCDGLGVCAGSDPVVCQALDQCHDAGVCDSQMGCSNPPKPQGTGCNDGTSCTHTDVCDGLGTCAGTAFTCPDPGACQESVACDGAGGCTVANKPQGATCTEGGQTGQCDDTGTCIINQPPTADAGPDQQITYTTIPPTVSLNGCGSTDDGLPGGPLSFSWQQVAGTTVTLSDPSACAPSFIAPTLAASSSAMLTFVLTVGDDLLSASDEVNVMVSNTNRPPTCNATADLSVAEGTPVTLDGSSSFDPDGDPLTLTWLQIAGPQVVLDVVGGLLSFDAPFIASGGDPTANEALVFELTAGDGSLSSSCTTTVTVENVNHCPSADAGPGQTAQPGEQVTLDGSGSSDPDADTLTFSWVQTAGPTVTLSGADSASATFVTPAAGAAGIDLVFELTVDDGYGCSDTQAVTIVVSGAGDPPSCENARASRRVLWPPNRKLTAVKVVNVAAGDLPATITINGVTQDEPVDGVADGHTSPDVVVVGSKVLLRRERSGQGNGRVYHVGFTATNAAGSCSGTVRVCVPHSLRFACWNRPWKRGSCQDEGGLYDSTQGSGL